MKKLKQSDFEKAAAKLNCDVAAVKAVVEVESSGRGFNANGQPVILFEGHIFHRLTGGKYSTPENANISHKRWVRTYYRQDQHKRLQKAVKLDRAAALQSASWGLFQIMGFNYKACGFRSLQDFINAMYKSEYDHLLAFIGFIESKGLDKYLRSKNWSSFARGYNGSGYKVNRYDKKLEAAYQKHS